ncbi:MAG: TMEM165/GDT1 family protein [Pseudomonadota bacterium]
MRIFIESFFLVALSEMGDKTQLLAFSLAARFKRPWPILGGIFLATLINHALASAAGTWISAEVNPRLMNLALSLTFIGFGLWTLKPDREKTHERTLHFGIFLTTLILFFLAEMGDKTQLATLALGARFQSIVWVTAGTTLGMTLADGLAVVLGDRLSHRIPMSAVRWIAALAFFAFGISSFVSFFRAA